MFRRHTLIPSLMLLTMALVWGATFVFVKTALKESGPFSFLTMRFSLAFAVLALPLRARLRRGGRALWQAGGALGTVLFAAHGLQTVGLRTTTATRAGFLTSLFVVLVPLLSALILRRPPSPRIWIAALLAVLGLALLSRLWAAPGPQAMG